MYKTRKWSLRAQTSEWQTINKVVEANFIVLENSSRVQVYFGCAIVEAFKVSAKVETKIEFFLITIIKVSEVAETFKGLIKID